MKSTDEPLYFDDVEIGNQWETPGRAVTESDVLAFADLSGDHNPLHVDAEFAKSTPFGRQIAHGLYGLSLVAGLASHSPRMKTLSFLKILEWNFLHPIYFGDVVHVQTEALAKEPKARGRRGIITWRRRLINQDGQVVQEGTTQTLVEGRADR